MDFTGLLSIQGMAKKIRTDTPMATTPQNLASSNMNPSTSAPTASVAMSLESGRVLLIQTTAR